ncbi:MAG TPA: radical SAM family heme chaperone HemW [Candidatus Baltobacteraceae bacterium]|nr:radical SAM family heme chaperone HemW [Candidatus Baltobacteraceae bacterium]
MPLGIYVHLPFCPYVCPYCDFAKWPFARSRAARYLDALNAEIAALPAQPASTIFIGGGTPNTYPPASIAALIATLRERFPAAAARHEISIEINPELARERAMDEYTAAGIDRISIGVQSFEPREIAVLGRRHTRADIEHAVEQARRAGARSVSLDLIFGVPGQSAQSWERSLDAALALGVDHISTYGLTVEAGTPYERWREAEPAAFADDEAEAELYEIAITRLEAAGYEQYEISNFARPSHRCAHNENYWRNGEYLGLGVGAASYRGGERSVHTRDLEQYMSSALAGRPIPGQSERLEGLPAVGEALMLALRTAQGVALEEFKERYGVDVAERYAPVIARYEGDGLLERSGHGIRLTKRGRFLANDVCGAFVTFT